MKWCRRWQSALDHTEKPAGETCRGVSGWWDRPQAGTPSAHGVPEEKGARAESEHGDMGLQALTAGWGQQGAVPPTGTVPGKIDGLIVPAPVGPLPAFALHTTAGSEARPRRPQPRGHPPPPHLLQLEAEPDGLRALVVGDDPAQGGRLLGLLHPHQVGSRVAVLALCLRGGHGAVRGHRHPATLPQGWGDSRPCTPVGLPLPRPRCGAGGNT